MGWGPPRLIDQLGRLGEWRGRASWLFCRSGRGNCCRNSASPGYPDPRPRKMPACACWCTHTHRDTPNLEPSSTSFLTVDLYSIQPYPIPRKKAPPAALACSSGVSNRLPSPLSFTQAQPRVCCLESAAQVAQGLPCLLPFSCVPSGPFFLHLGHPSPHLGEAQRLL